MVLVDAAQSRPSASWAGGGILSPLFPWRYDASWRPLVADSLQRYQGWLQSIASETGLSPEINLCGMLVRESDVAQAKRWADAEQVALQPASESGLPEVFSRHADVWMPEIGAVRNSRWLAALTSLCEARGIKRVRGTVESFAEHPDRVDVVVDAEVFQATQAVVAAGHWSKRLLCGSAAIANDLMPVKGEMLLYQLEPGEVPAILLADTGYLIPRQDGLVLAGSTLNVGIEEMRPTETAHRTLAESAADWCPALAGREPIAHWAGVRPGTSRSQPLIGRVSEGSRICLATGHFRNGLVSAPATGQLVAEILSGEGPFCDAAPYSPSPSSRSSSNFLSR